MPAKTTGAEWKRFYGDKKSWPDGSYHEDEEFIVDGIPFTNYDNLYSVADTAKIIIAGGTVFMKNDDTDGPSLEAHFKNWRRQQRTTIFVCEAPLGLAETVKYYIRAAGGKVLK